MIERVWKQDADFYASHRTDVDREIALCVLRLLKLHLRLGDASGARSAADALRGLGQVPLPASASFYRRLAMVPGAAVIVPALDSLRRLLARS
jgi:hypothetical protein